MQIFESKVKIVLTYDLALETAQFFRSKNDETEQGLKRIRGIVSLWREYASRAGIGWEEQELMQRAFRF